MLVARQSNRFKREIKIARKQGKDIARLEAIVRTLANGQLPAAKHRDHLLTGNWSGHRECHIAPDWLLIYKIEGNELMLVRTGSHSELFG